MMKRSLLILIVLSIVSLSVSGCGLFNRNPEPTPTVAAPVGVQPTDTPAPQPTDAQASQPTDEPQPTGDASAEEPDIDLSKAFAVLENLDTYRYRITMEMTTIRGNKVVTMTSTDLSEVNRTQNARRNTITSSSSEAAEAGESAHSIQSIRIGNKSWINFNDEGWEGQMEGVGGPSFEEMLVKPEDMLDGVMNLRRVLPDQRINGIDSRHYTYNKDSLPPDTFKSWKVVKRYDGEVWIAKNDDFVVKTTLLSEGTIEIEGELSENTMKFVTEVFDVNQPINIEPPVVVPRDDDEEEGTEADETPEAMPMSSSDMDELPRMDDATVEMAFGPMVSYSTSAGLDEVAEFYQEELAALGWEMEGDLYKVMDTIIMEYSKDVKSLNVNIFWDTDEEMTHIMLMGVIER